MYIERIDIESFGKLKNVPIPINNRINVFYGPNESGKSMIAAFIKFMFYGYKGVKENNVSENERKLYTPWDTNKVAGSIIVHFKDRKYKIEREYSERERTRIIDLNTNITLQDIGEEPGEFFFKMSEEVFTKTAFLKQFHTSEIGGESLASMIQNIMFTADEDLNTQKTLQRLKDAGSKLMSEDNDNPGGMIINLSAKRDGLKNSFSDSINDQRELLYMEGIIKDLEEKMHSNNAKKNELQDEIENYKAYNAGQELQKIDNARSQVSMLKAAANRVIERYSHENFVPDMDYSRKLMEAAAQVGEKKEKLQNAIEQRNISLAKYNDCADKNKSFKIIEAAGGIEEIGEEYTKIKNSAGIFRGLKTAFIILAIVSALGAGGLFLLNIVKNPVSFAVPVIFAVGAGICISAEKNKKLETEEYYKSFDFNTESDFAYILDDYPDTEAQLAILQNDLEICENTVIETEKVLDEVYSNARELLLKWNRTPDSDDKKAEDFIKYARSASEAAEEIQKALNTYEKQKQYLDSMVEGVDEKNLRKLAAAARKPNYDEKQVARELDYLIKANASMHEKERDIGKNIATVSAKLPDPVILQSQIEFLEDKISDLQIKYAALKLAVETLEQSCSELRNSVAPRLTEAAGNAFKTLTGSKYEDLLVDRNMELDFNSIDNSNDENIIKRKIDYLSAGTRDAAYMCLRVALLELLFENEMPPLICDESFAHMDSGRIENLMKIFVDLSRKTQIFVFTCHEREANMFGNNPDVKVLTMNL